MILGLVVRQRVERLQHEDAEYHYRIVRQVAPAAAVGVVEGCFQLGAEQLEVDHNTEALQRIAGYRQRCEQLGHIEKAGLSRHCRLRSGSLSESDHASICYGSWRCPIVGRGIEDQSTSSPKRGRVVLG